MVTSKKNPRGAKTIWIQHETFDRLSKFGRYPDTADEIVNRVLEIAERATVEVKHR